MKGGLFWRTYSVIVAALLITILIFSGVLVAARQQVQQESYEQEVRLQAREVADYMANLNKLSYVQRNVTMKPIILNKIRDIYQRYNADIWIVSYDSGIVQYLDSSWNTSESIASDAVKEQLSAIQTGQEIRVTGLFPELGDQIVTIGGFLGTVREVRDDNDTFQIELAEGIRVRILKSAVQTKRTTQQPGQAASTEEKDKHES